MANRTSRIWLCFQALPLQRPAVKPLQNTGWPGQIAEQLKREQRLCRSEHPHHRADDTGFAAIQSGLIREREQTMVA